MKLSIRRPIGVLWSEGYTREKVESALALGKITEDWLVCPHGEAEHRTTVGSFLATSDLVPQRIASDSKAPEPELEENESLSLPLIGWCVLAGGLFLRFVIYMEGGVRQQALGSLESAAVATIGDLALTLIFGGVFLLIGSCLVKMRRT